MRTPRTLIRDWCTAIGDSWSDLNGRWRSVLDAGASPKGAGRHTPPATEREAATIVLASLVTPLWKDAPAGIQIYGGLIVTGFAHTKDFSSRFGEETCISMQAQFENRTLLDTLMICLRTFRSDTEIRFLSLSVEQSDYEPRASLHLGDPLSQTTTFAISFAEREGPRGGVLPDPGVRSVGMGGYVLPAMADLLADNLQSTHENGPSEPTDEPLPSDETPRGANPATTQTHPKARRQRDKSQAGFESYGNSSGGSSLSIRGTPDEARPRRCG